MELYNEKVLIIGCGLSGSVIGRQLAEGVYQVTNIEKFRGDKELCAEYCANCRNISFDTIYEYYERIMKVYH